MYTVSSIAHSLSPTYHAFRLNHLAPASCVHETIMAEVQRLVKASGGILTLQEIGRSIEGRSINMVTAGSGPRTIMLWSQMHGDEPTATLAMMDILNLVAGEALFPWVAQMLRCVTLCFIPILNPDGAERKQRQNAVGIDINRDAAATVSPEAQTLVRAHRQLRPEFGFNLHDQGLRSVGGTAQPVALALLAPPFDEQRTLSHTRIRAMRIGAVVVRALQSFGDGHITRYADDFEPRAFGDYFQSQGTSTLLIESGYLPRDPQKAMIRKMNVIALLAGFWSIAVGSYEDVDLDLYASLPPNNERMFDVLIRGLVVRHANGWKGVADIGIQFEPNTDRAVIKEIGDLHPCGGLETHTLSERTLPVELSVPGSTVKRQWIYDLLQIYQDSPGNGHSA
jgi:hypothetical protein